MTTRIEAEMTANVWKILVSLGDEVQAGADLVILESMKMEIPVSADHAGTVSEIEVTEGETVDEGDLIIVLDS